MFQMGHSVQVHTMSDAFGAHKDVGNPGIYLLPEKLAAIPDSCKAAIKEMLHQRYAPWVASIGVMHICAYSMQLNLL